MIKIMKALLNNLKSCRQFYKSMKAMGLHGGKDIQGEAAIKRMKWIKDVSYYTPSDSELELYELYDHAKENGISKEGVIEIILKSGMDIKHIITALDWMLYVADHSPLTIPNMIASNLYSFARVHGHSKEDIINIACRIGSDPENILRILNEGDMECINIMGIKEFKEILFEQKTWCLIELSHRTKLSEDEVSKMLLKSLSYTDAKGKLSIPFVLSMNTELRPDGVYITPEWYDEQLTKLNVH